jgi:hypothetical protein
MARKSEVYTWRVSAATKASLEEAARSTNRSVAQVLDDIVADHLSSTMTAGDSEAAHQRRVHQRAARFRGCLSGGQRSERIRELVRARLKRRQSRAH